MNKIFLFAKHAKTSENCNKLSTSVSYETLVGGTTTVGSAKRQNQRLNESSAFVPLTAAGTFSALSNASKVHENLLQMPLVFRLAKVLTLAAMLSTGIISESWAAWSDYCPSGTTAGTNCKQCGAMCAYTEDQTHVVTLYGKGRIYGYSDNPHPFYYNSSITGVQFADGSNFQTINDYAFSGMSGVTGTLTIPDSVTRIGTSAFYYMSGVTGTLTIPDSVTYISANAFTGMSGVTGTLTIPDSVTRIDSGTFAYMSGVSSLTIPDSLTYIGDAAFLRMSGVSSLTIPDSLTYIGDRAFKDMSGLNEIIIPDSFTADQATKLKNAGLKNNLTVYCQGDSDICKAMLDTAGYSYADVKPADSTRCNTLKHAWDETTGQCKQRTVEQCNSVAKYYYSNGKCQLLPRTQSACQTPLIWLNNKCYKQMPCPSNCGSCDVEGICTECETGYLINGHNCISADKCKNGFHGDNGACVENTVANCNTEINGKCTECNSGLLEQAGGCVSSCGAGYKQFENFCNRIRYTPAEAAAILNDDDNTITITFKK